MLLRHAIPGQKKPQELQQHRHLSLGVRTALLDETTTKLRKQGAFLAGLRAIRSVRKEPRFKATAGLLNIGLAATDEQSAQDLQVCLGEYEAFANETRLRWMKGELGFTAPEPPHISVRSEEASGDSFMTDVTLDDNAAPKKANAPSIGAINRIDQQIGQQMDDWFSRALDRLSSKDSHEGSKTPKTPHAATTPKTPRRMSNIKRPPMDYILSAEREEVATKEALLETSDVAKLNIVKSLDGAAAIEQEALLTHTSVDLTSNPMDDNSEAIPVSRSSSVSSVKKDRTTMRIFRVQVPECRADTLGPNGINLRVNFGMHAVAVESRKSEINCKITATTRLQEGGFLWFGLQGVYNFQANQATQGNIESQVTLGQIKGLCQFLNFSNYKIRKIEEVGRLPAKVRVGELPVKAVPIPSWLAGQTLMGMRSKCGVSVLAVSTPGAAPFCFPEPGTQLVEGGSLYVYLHDVDALENYLWLSPQDETKPEN